MGHPECQERTRMKLSGGRCFCLMLGVSLLAHGGLFLNRSPMVRLSEPQTAPLSLRLAVTPAPTAPINTVEPSSQAPPAAPQETTLPRPAVRQEPPFQKRSAHHANPEKRRTPSTKTPPSKASREQETSAKAPFPSSPQNAAQPPLGKPETTGPQRTSFDAVDGPKFLQPPAPRYPRLARRKGIEGQVLMELTIDAEGRLMSASIKKSGGNGFDEAALEAVRKAIFRPATHNGRPSACIVLLPIHFTLRNAS
ncbi:energy transducer TonB [uncultured Bilophila sp.]|uniref:energy transducer TonB n=1 Tax=uncultured Bilophila sp. TaxID=529385 RepID=UPI00280BE598|nr:energy transducer TonB [uncultured Bilophila sp.]